MHLKTDTIAAISTAWGEAGISVIRLSGPEATELAEKCLRTAIQLSAARPRQMIYGHLVDPDGLILDEVLAVRFEAPRSYTAEDVAEIHCHGGSLVAQKCLEILLDCGARLADPGEFTRRAFLNGRLDLAQAEAVLGIIRARSESALLAANRTLRGELSSLVAALRESILNLSALMESSLDYPEEDLPEFAEAHLLETICDLQSELKEVRERCRIGLVLREGIRVALVGRPNVGKSSLLNALLAEARAIVTAIPGTTRDVIEEVLTHRGVPLRLVDTAGIRRPTDEVEAQGIRRSFEALERADMTLFVLDGSEPLTQEDRDLLESLNGRPHAVILNKADLPLQISQKSVETMDRGAACRIISAQRGEGIEEVKDLIVGESLDKGLLDTGLNATARQIGELENCSKALVQASEILGLGLGQDVAASALTEARLALERFLGIEGGEILLDRIFGQFCLGK